MNIPTDERKVSDAEFFAALDLTRRGLSSVRQALGQDDLDAAKAALVEYFCTREQPKWFFDLRLARQRGRCPSTRGSPAEEPVRPSQRKGSPGLRFRQGPSLEDSRDATERLHGLRSQEVQLLPRSRGGLRTYWRLAVYGQVRRVRGSLAVGLASGDQGVSSPHGDHGRGGPARHDDRGLPLVLVDGLASSGYSLRTRCSCRNRFLDDQIPLVHRSSVPPL